MTGVCARFWRGSALSAALGVIAGAGAAQPNAKPIAFAKLEPGLWRIEEVDGKRRGSRSICLGDPAAFIQLEHRESACSRLVITNEPQEVTVHYTCPANGYGRTSVRVQTPRIARIETQGIAGNAPFAYRTEARRTGPCRTAR